MKRTWQRVFLFLIPAVAAASTTSAQQPAGLREPHIGYVYPAGGQRGTTIEVKVGGQFLNGVTDALISGQGVIATFVKYYRPLRPGEATRLREKMQRVRERMREELRARRRPFDPEVAARLILKYAKDEGITEDQLRGLVEARQQRLDPKRQLNPQIAETVTLRIQIAPDAEPGPRELRLRARTGISNPVRFEIGELPEYQEGVADSQRPRAWLLALLGRRQAKRRGVSRRRMDRLGTEADDVDRPPTPVDSLPAIVNGQILPGEIDRFRFMAKKGQRLVVAVKARRLIPYLADAVPGWFQATVALYDATGQEIAFADDYHFQPDPVLAYEVPEDGQYVLEVRDALYRGREDFVYRITVGEVPWITDIFPLGCQQGQTATVYLNGWNLPTDSLTIDTTQKPPGLLPLSVAGELCRSNRVPFAVGTLPESTEREPNDGYPTRTVSPTADRNVPLAAVVQTVSVTGPRSGAQPVELPIIVNGRIDRPGDRDVFQFEGRAGQRVIAEVYARRLHSPVDSVLKLIDAEGHMIASNDDHEDKGAGLTTHHADSLINAVLPADGVYYVLVGDTQNQGGPECAYRLRISSPQPDFELRVVPSNLNVRPGLSVPITVYALRRDGFEGEITLQLKDAPPGFTLSGGWIPAGQDRVRLTLAVPARVNQDLFRLSLEGWAMINGREVRHQAVPAEDMMQAFIYRHLVPAEEWLVAVNGRGRFGPPARVLGEKPIRLPAGSTAAVRIFLPGASRMAQAQMKLELLDPPDGVTLKDVQFGPFEISLLLSADAKKVAADLKGNLLVEAYIERTIGPAGTAARRKRRIPVATLPAIPFQVVAP
ncbi:MAG: hypothetical protein GXP27_02125 [Planctomycetes bacterium]|nr:hypothetical protein [Planctomycetota bacterium]